MTESLRVLVVDDEVPLTQVVGSYLEREGFTVAVAHTGPDAVEEARAVGTGPDRARRHAARLRRDRGVPADPAVLRRLHHHAHRPRRGGRQDPRPVDGSRRLPRQAVLAARAHRPRPGHAAPPPPVHGRALRRAGGHRRRAHHRHRGTHRRRGRGRDRPHPNRVRPPRRDGQPAQGGPHPPAAHRRRVGTGLVRGRARRRRPRGTPAHQARRRRQRPAVHPDRPRRRLRNGRPDEQASPPGDAAHAGAGPRRRRGRRDPHHRRRHRRPPAVPRPPDPRRRERPRCPAPRGGGLRVLVRHLRRRSPP